VNSKRPKKQTSTRDLNESKSRIHVVCTYINQKRPTKQAYSNQKRPTKEAYIIYFVYKNELKATYKRDPHQSKSSKSIKEPNKRDLFNRKRPTKEAYIFHFVYISELKATYKRDPNQSKSQIYRYVSVDWIIYSYLKGLFWLIWVSFVGLFNCNANMHIHLGWIDITKRATKQTHIHQNRPTKETYINQKRHVNRHMYI